MSASHPERPADALASAIDHLAAGQWQAAHEIVQKHDSALAAWLHGIVHILEGDLSNAQGWYRRANRPFPGGAAAAAEIAEARVAVQALARDTAFSG
jgi:hypothetical protein